MSYNGTRVQDRKGYFGTVEGEPVLTASGEVVTVVMDDEHLSPSGRCDYLVSDLCLWNGAPLCPANDGLNGGLDKARDFEEFARKRGWSALAQISSNDYGTATVTAERGDVRISLVWREGKFSYASSRVHTVGTKREVLRSRKIRNVSAARKLIAG